MLVPPLAVLLGLEDGLHPRVAVLENLSNHMSASCQPCLLLLFSQALSIHCQVHCHSVGSSVIDWETLKVSLAA